MDPLRTLTDYIRQQRALHHHDDAIRHAILKQGYPAKLVSKAFREVDRENRRKDKKKISPLPYIISVVLLLGVVSSILIWESFQEPTSGNGSYQSYKEMYESIGDMKLEYTMDITGSPANMNIVVSKSGDVTRSLLTFSLHGKNTNYTYYTVKNISIFCDAANLCQVSNSTLIPDLRLMSNEFVNEGLIHYGDSLCNRFRTTSRVAIRNDALGTNASEWHYDICLDNEEGYEHYVHAYSPVMNYSIMLLNVSHNRQDITIPAEMVMNVTCMGTGISADVTLLKQISEPVTATLYYYTLPVKSRKIELTELNEHNKKKVSFEVANHKPGRYTVQVCTESFCSFDRAEC